MGARTAIQTAIAKVEDNLDYRSANSVTKAVLLIEGAEGLLILRGSSQEKGGTTTESIRFDQSALERWIREAKRWVSLQRTRSRGFKQILRTGRCYRD